LTTPYGVIVLPGAEPALPAAATEKPKGKELKKLMKAQAKLKALQEKEARKEAKLRKQEEKRNAKESKKKKVKEQPLASEKARTSTLHSFHNPPRLVNLASFVRSIHRCSLSR
jgi:hypothetical protein